MKTKTEIEIIIDGILGRDKFLMVNLKLVKALAPNGALLLTYLLDRMKYFGKTQTLQDNEGFYVFRRDITKQLNLSPYQQRNIERDLMNKDLLMVKEERIQGETFNKYYLNLTQIFSLVED